MSLPELVKSHVTFRTGRGAPWAHPQGRELAPGAPLFVSVFRGTPDRLIQPKFQIPFQLSRPRGVCERAIRPAGAGRRLETMDHTATSYCVHWFYSSRGGAGGWSQQPEKAKLCN